MADSAFGIVEDDELSKDGRSVVVDPLASDLVLVVEFKNRAHRKLDLTAGAGKTAPHAVMGAAHGDFQDHTLVGHVTPVNIDMEVGECSK